MQHCGMFSQSLLRCISNKVFCVYFLDACYCEQYKNIKRYRNIGFVKVMSLATYLVSNVQWLTFLAAFNQTWGDSTGLDGSPSIKFRRNTSIGSVTDDYGQTEIEKEMTRLIGVFLDKAKAPKFIFTKKWKDQIIIL
jgi:hypothetical protein